MNRLKWMFLALALAFLPFLPVPAAAKDSSPALDMARQLNQAFIEVADTVSPAVVVITVVQKPNTRGLGGAEDSIWEMLPPELRKKLGKWGAHPRVPSLISRGSGIIVSEDGYILTNNHVVENGSKITVRFKDGKEMDAEVKGTDPESDIAVLKIKASGLTPAKLGDSDKTRVGEFAIAIGAPFDLSYSVTVGHVSAKGRSFEGYFGESYSDQDFIQTDASINPGNSGGPLVNLYGEVIGINTMIRGMNTGIGFAIPINLVKRVKDHLIAEGKFTRSWIGVRIGDVKALSSFKDLDPGLLPNVEEGVVVDEIEANSPAARSSLKPFDVIVAVDGEAVKTPRQLKDMISTKKVGQNVTLDVVRGSKHFAVKLKTEALPVENNEKVKPQAGDQGEESALGLSVQTMNRELADQFDEQMIEGVIVTSVETDSPADEQGIKPGDIINEVNRKPVTNARDFREMLKKADPKRSLLLNVVSGGSIRMVVLRPGD